MTLEKASNMHRSAAMDGVRGLAVLTVFLSHTAGRQQALTPFLQFQGIGLIGVYLFFVLSGYLLASNLIDESRKYGHISVKNFLIRRFLRIAPLYYLVISLVFLYQQYTGQQYPAFLHITDSWSSYFRHLLFIKGDGVFWTVPTEFVFYLGLPFVVIFLLSTSRTGFRLVCVAACLYFVWFVLILLKQIPASWALKVVEINHVSQYLDVFLCGVLGAFIHKNQSAGAFISSHAKRISNTATVLLFVTLIISCAMVAFSFMGFHRPFFNFRWFSLGYGVVFTMIILATSVSGLTRRIFEFKGLRFLGTVGFSWYLIHLFVIQMVNLYISTPPLRFVSSFLGCAVLSSLLYLGIEKPFIELGKKLTRKELKALKVAA